MDLVEFDVYINEDLTLTVKTDRKSAERAFTDPDYLQEITTQELNKLNMQAAEAVNESNNSIQTTCEKENDEQCEEKNLSFWTPNDTRLLLTIYKEKESNLKTGRLKQGQFWETVAKEINKINPKVQKTAMQCSNKIACLKRTYKNIKDHNNKSGNNRKNWTFYEDMDDIFGNRAWISPKCLASEAGSSQSSSFSSTSSSSPAPCKVPKRKREVLLEELINDNKGHYKEKKIREEKKLEMLEKFRQEKINMHKEKLKMQQKLLDALTKVNSTKN